MPSCLSALLPRTSRRADSQQAHRDEKLPSSLARSAHSSCGHCSQWASDLLPAYTREDLQPSPSPSASPAIPMTALTTSMASDIHSTIASLSPTLRDLSLKMWEYHEPAFTEHKTHDLFVDFFTKQKGWHVTPHANGLETAWRAEFTHLKSGEKATFQRGTKKEGQHVPTVGFQSELDSLPGIGHACGHNLIAIGGVGAALSVASSLVKHDLTGRVVLLGTPAEEGGGGKVIMLEDGAYKGMDACLMIHPAVEDAIGPLLAVVPLTVTFTGATAHAGGSPEQGINAQDAAILSYNNISLLRQQLATSVRVHGIIIADPDWAPNVIPGKAKMIWNVRSTTRDELEVVKAKVLKCFQAAALATGCKIEIEEGRTYDDVRNAKRLKDDYIDFIKEKFHTTIVEKPVAVSTDFGNISHVLPSVHPMYLIPVDDPKTQGNHTVGFTAAAKTRAAHECTLRATEGIAVLGMRVLAQQEYRDTLWREWEEWKRGEKGGVK